MTVRKLFIVIILLLTLACNFTQLMAVQPTPHSVATIQKTNIAEISPEPSVSEPSSTVEFSNISPYNMHPIGVRTLDGDAQFFNTVTDERFIPRGSNYIDFKETIPTKLWEDYIFGEGTYQPEKVRAEFGKLSDNGYNTVRLFFDHCYSGPSCIGNRNGNGLNPVFLDHMVEIMNIAAEENLYLLLTANGVPLDGNYYSRFEREFNANPLGFNTFYGGAYYLHRSGINMQEQYWRDLMSGLQARNAPFDTIFAWEIQNEYFLVETDDPLNRNSGLVTAANGQTYDLSNAQQKHDLVDDNVVYLVDRIKSVINEYDPGTLVTLGFFPSNYPNDWGMVPDWYRDAGAVIDRANVDFWDFHIYPETEDIPASMQMLVQNLGMEMYHEKPVLIGEYGISHSSYGSEDVSVINMQQWMIESCKYGVDGWLVWEHLDRDDFWSMIDDEDLLLNAVAPVNWPDACVDAPPRVSISNLAYQRPVRVSAFHPDLPGSAVTDGSMESIWTAGTHGPQWVEIDLESPQAVNRIKLFVTQDPAGESENRIYAIRSDGSRVLIGLFHQITRQGDLLEIDLPGIVEDVRTIRVESPLNPGWVGWQEIEIYNQAADQESACLLQPSGTIMLFAQPINENPAISTVNVGGQIVPDGYTNSEDQTWYHLPGGLWIPESAITAGEHCENLEIME